MENEVEIVERVARLESDVKNVQEGNKLFRDEIREEIKEIRKQNESIYEIATSVKVMAQDIQGLRGDVQEVKMEQKDLNRKIDDEINVVKQDQNDLRETIEDVDHKEANKALKFWNSIKDKLAWLVIGAVAAYLLYQAFPFLK